jgi:hypothetical protein
VFSKTIKTLLLSLLAAGCCGLGRSKQQQSRATIMAKSHSRNQPCWSSDFSAGHLGSAASHFKGPGLHSLHARQEIRETAADYTGWYTDTDLIKVGEAKCQVERLMAKPETTKVIVTSEDRKTQITEVRIKGKRAMYVF